MSSPEYKYVKKSLYDVGLLQPLTAFEGEMVRDDGIELFATYSGQAPLLKEWSKGAQINTDRNLRLQFLAGMSLNNYMGDGILSSILASYKFPKQTFVGSPESIQALKQVLERKGRTDRE